MPIITKTQSHFSGSSSALNFKKLHSKVAPYIGDMFTKTQVTVIVKLRALGVYGAAGFRGVQCNVFN